MQKSKKQKTNLCSQIFSWGWKIVVVVIIAPPFLNYASLKNEEIHLQPEGKKIFFNPFIYLQLDMETWLNKDFALLYFKQIIST